MTNKFQIQNFQLLKRRQGLFGILVFRALNLFEICFLSFGICLKHNFNNTIK
jgi:hypothetical protein